jgi:hypothetical protein
VRAIDVGNEDVVAVFVRHFALRRIAQREKREAKEDNQRFHRWWLLRAR